MSKYDPFFRLLRSTKTDLVPMTFANVNSALGFLPPSAVKRRQWWENQRSCANRPQCRAWRETGFKVEQADFVKETVEFRRDTSNEEQIGLGRRAEREARFHGPCRPL